MVEHLPEYIDPLALADKHRRFKGSFPLSKMTRLQDVLLDQAGEVKFELEFGKDGKYAVVTGVVKAELVLQCQCCLGSIPWTVNGPVSLAVVGSIDEADLLPDSYEPLLLEEQSIPLSDIVQEELLLAVPTIPQHEKCGVSMAKPSEPVQEAPKRPNPFAVLAKLKK